MFLLDLKATQLIKNDLCSSGLAIDNVSGVVRVRKTGSVRLILNDVLSLTGSKAIITAALSKLCLHSAESLCVSGLRVERAVQTRDFVVVKLLCNTVLGSGNCRSSTCKALTKTILNLTGGLTDVLVYARNTKADVSKRRACRSLIKSRVCVCVYAVLSVK